MNCISSPRSCPDDRGDETLKLCVCLYICLSMMSPLESFCLQDTFLAIASALVLFFLPCLVSRSCLSFFRLFKESFRAWNSSHELTFFFVPERSSISFSLFWHQVSCLVPFISGCIGHNFCFLTVMQENGWNKGFLLRYCCFSLSSFEKKSILFMLSSSPRRQLDSTGKKKEKKWTKLTDRKSF